MIEPHVAEKIEEGAILYSSWGYDQTNVDFYVVTRCTAKSAWILPLSGEIVEVVGWASENVVAGDQVQYNSGWCECGHRLSNHGTVLNMVGDDFPHCRGAYGDDCDCHELRPVANKPAMHRIRRWGYGDDAPTRESLSLTSYSSASLWDGGQRYASHYA